MREGINKRRVRRAWSVDRVLICSPVTGWVVVVDLRLPWKGPPLPAAQMHRRVIGTGAVSVVGLSTMVPSTTDTHPGGPKGGLLL